MELFESIEMFRSKESTCQAGAAGDVGSGRSLEEETATHSSFLPGDSHGQRSLAGYSPEGHKESDRTEGTQHIPTWEIRSITDDFSTDD